MTNSSSNSMVRQDGWKDVLVRTLTVFVIGFVTLNLKEWFETREWDIPACALDASIIAAATFVYYAILTMTSGGARRPAVPQVLESASSSRTPRW